MLENLNSEFPVHTPRKEGAPKALEGVRVLELGHYVAAPIGTMIMADMGADVIKVESPLHGDEFRHYGPVPKETPGQGAPYMWTNRNKRSLAIDLKCPEGVALIHKLFAWADVVCENFSTGVAERLGLDYERAKAINPKIIYCTISAYGRDGAFIHRLGFDPIAQAESGYMSLNGDQDRQAMRSQAAIMDISTGMMACNAILGALLARERTGVGQLIDVGLFDTAILMSGWAAMQHLYTGIEPQRFGNVGPDNCPSGVYICQDKAFFLHCANDKLFQRLATQVLNRPDLVDHPHFVNRATRLANKIVINKQLDEIFAQQPWSYWQPRMRNAQIPCGEVRTVGEALRSAEASERKMVSRIKHPVLGWIPNIRLPINYSHTSLVDPKPAPVLGENTIEILSEILELDATQIDALASTGALGAAKKVA